MNYTLDTCCNVLLEDRIPCASKCKINHDLREIASFKGTTGLHMQSVRLAGLFRKLCNHPPLVELKCPFPAALPGHVVKAAVSIL